MGRNRNRQASRIASSGLNPRSRWTDERKIDHHDSVLLDDTDQEDHADQRDHAEIEPEQHQHQQRANASRRQSGQDGQRMYVAFIQHAENEVDDDDRGGDKERLGHQ